MGEEFWWFYDVIVVAAVLVCGFIASKQGIFKGVITITGNIVAVVLAFSLSGFIANFYYNNSTESEIIKKMSAPAANSRFALKMSDYIDNLGYNGLSVNSAKIEAIYKSDASKKSYDEQIYSYVNSVNGKEVDRKEVFLEKLHKGYADVVKNIVSAKLSKYAAEYAAREVEKDPDSMNKLIPLLMETADGGTENNGAAQYIAENYIKSPYKNHTKLVAFIVLMIVFIAAALFIASSAKVRLYDDMKVATLTVGALIGIANGAIITLVASAIVRLNVVTGSDTMLFFNNKAIDKTFVFKFFYQFITDKF